MMFASLHRHPFAVQAFFRRSLVLTFAYPAEMLQTMLPDCLQVDRYENVGFLAIALVETEGLRPLGFPAFMGRDFFLSGYRIFSRYRRQNGKELRGLRILQSFTDSQAMVIGGNVFTRYNYRRCRVENRHDLRSLSYAITTANGQADVSVTARIDTAALTPPHGSPFPNLTIARRFAGPLPFTFGYEADTRTMVIVQGVRQHWQPMPVHIESLRCTFLERPPFAAYPMQLANAFFIERIPYHWKRGETERPPDRQP